MKPIQIAELCPGDALHRPATKPGLAGLADRPAPLRRFTGRHQGAPSVKREARHALFRLAWADKPRAEGQPTCRLPLALAQSSRGRVDRRPRILFSQARRFASRFDATTTLPLAAA